MFRFLDRDDLAFNTRDALAAMGLLDDDAMMDAVQMATQKGALLRRLPIAADWTSPIEPGAFLLAWPSLEQGIICLVETDPDSGELVFAGAWPFERSGPMHSFVPQEVLFEPAAHVGAVKGSAEDMGLTLFDSFCQAGDGLREGEAIGARIHGWAISLSPADPSPTRLDPSKVQPSVAETFTDLDQDGMIVIQTQGMASIFPSFGQASPYYSIRGPVKSVSPPRRFLDCVVRTAIVTIARPGPDHLDFDVPISFSSKTWKGAPPSVGDDVEGVVWLQATFDLPLEDQAGPAG